MAKVFEQVDFEGMKVELIGVFGVVYMGGWAYNNFFLGNADFLSVAIAHFFAYALFIWSSFKISGGFLNPALTMSMIISKRLKLFQGLFYIVCQLIGSLLAVSLLKLISPDRTSSDTKIEKGVFGHPVPSEKLVAGIYDIIGTFLVVLIYYTVAVGNKEKSVHLHGIGVGSAYLTNMLIYGKQGASANIARIFGPFCLGEQWMSLLIVSAGSLLGAFLATLVSEKIILKDLKESPAVNSEELMAEHPKESRAPVYLDDNSVEAGQDDVQMHL